MNQKCKAITRSGKTEARRLSIFTEILQLTKISTAAFAQVVLCGKSRRSMPTQSMCTIDSYGGAVSEGWAIYNALLQHPAKINTYGDGFVASAALFPFLAGDNRYASNLSAYYLHEVLVSACGYADDLRAAAQDADTMTSIGIRAFVERAGMREEDIRELMRSETWLTPEQALEYNIATAVTADASTLYTQDAKKQIFQRIFSTNCPHPERTIGKKPERAKKNNILKLFERG